MIDWLVLLFELAKLQIHFHPYVNQRNGCKIMRPANRKITNKTKIVNIDPHLHFIICCCCFVLAAPQGLWDLDSWIRDQTLASCSRSRKSKPLDHRESPLLVFFFFFFLSVAPSPASICIVLSYSVMTNSLWPPWTAASQAPLSMGFPGQEYLSGLLFPSPIEVENPAKTSVETNRKVLLESVKYLLNPYNL